MGDPFLHPLLPLLLFMCLISSLVSQLTEISRDQLDFMGQQKFKNHVAEFVSIDCGAATSGNYTDPVTGIVWTTDAAGIISEGATVQLENSTDLRGVQYRSRRDFPVDSDKKHCYTLSTEQRRRYLVRATFLYGSSQDEDAYPSFLLFLDATKWATVTVYDAARVYVKEMIIRAQADSVAVCLCCATTGAPFISTLELRPLNLSMYATDYEDAYWLKVAARVNFGASSPEDIRYPDDPYDRIWESDLVRRPNYLVGMAPGTARISTSKIIDVRTREYPPIKVMQTAVVGTQGKLTYRLNLEDFPANARAYAYFAEIEDLGGNDSRKFKMLQPYMPDYSNAVVNIAENTNGSYTLYEPSYMNVTLDFVLSFSFVKTPDSTRGPLLNAIEISKYVRIGSKTDNQDATVLDAFRAMAADSGWTNEEGDPCIPVHWEWVTCSSTTPPRITKIALSGKRLQGTIPSELNKMEGLTELWLDGNSLTGPLPDINDLINLKTVHLENNKLTGPLPTDLGSLPSLHELYVQNNSFSGEIPSALLTRKVHFFYEGNPDLTKGAKHNKHFKFLFGGLVVVAVLVLILVLLLHNLRRKAAALQKSDDKGESSLINTKPSIGYSTVRGRNLLDEGVACYMPFSKLEEATDKFSTKIGQGSFGPVYYGRMKDGKEIAVKIMADSSSHGTQQFVTEVALLSRIHHRNLVPLIGYCEEEYRRILVYEYMHNGTLHDHIHGPVNQKPLDWLARLQIAEDAAKGLEYLHTGCSPSIIHRDVKTNNILLDNHMRAKVSDFGLSRQAKEDFTQVSSMARGTLGYLDPEYYGNMQLTEKSDVYSFGVVLLELISGRRPFSIEVYGPEWSIVHWARSLIRQGDVVSILDPALEEKVKVDSVWRVAEIAIQCVEQRGVSRPRMQEIILAIQDAVKIERASKDPSGSKPQCSRKTLLTNFLEIESPDKSHGSFHPTAR